MKVKFIIVAKSLQNVCSFIPCIYQAQLSLMAKNELSLIPMAKQEERFVLLSLQCCVTNEHNKCCSKEHGFDQFVLCFFILNFVLHYKSEFHINYSHLLLICYIPRPTVKIYNTGANRVSSHNADGRSQFPIQEMCHLNITQSAILVFTTAMFFLI